MPRRTIITAMAARAVLARCASGGGNICLLCGLRINYQLPVEFYHLYVIVDSDTLIDAM